MHRLIVAFLAAFDAAIAVAVGIAATLAPLTLLWVFGLGDTADWAALWPSSAAVWEFGNLVPLAVTLPGDYLAATGIDESAASFTLSLAPLAFASFTAIFAARSGARASRADAWITGVLIGTAVFGILAALVAVTSQNPVAHAELWQAALFPTLLFGIPSLMGALATEWREAGAGVVARLRDRVEAWPGGWGPVVGVSARSGAAGVVGLVGAGALAFALAVVLRAGDIVALYQAGNLDLLGATVMTLAQLAYLPTLVVWSLAFVAGPGFGLGSGSAVSPSGTQVGVVPGVPILGAVPETSSTWLLLLVLLPVAVGAFAGWVARSRLLVAAGHQPRERVARERRKKTDAAAPAPALSTSGGPGDDARRATLEGLLAASPIVAEPSPAATVSALAADAAVIAEPSTPAEGREESGRAARPHEPVLPRLVVTIVISGIGAAAAALLCVFASGSAGPGKLAQVGPDPGPVALAVGLELLVGAGILLLTSRGGGDDDRDARAVFSRGASAIPSPPVETPSAKEAPPAVLPPPATVEPAPEEPLSAPVEPAPATAEPPPPPPAPDDTITAPIELPPTPDGPAERPSVD